MAHYYLDIETEGFNPETDKVVTIQFQALDGYGKAKGPLIILKEWEMGEENMIKTFYKKLFGNNVWEMIPHGTNLIFDFTFLWAKFKKYELDVEPLDKYLYSKPVIDIKHTLIIANDLEFKGSGLDQMTNKKTNGRNIPIFYKNKEFDKIEGYIKQETESFIECLEKLRTKLMEAFKKDGSLQ